jgi:uncharacterized protein (DUF736 family)
MIISKFTKGENGRLEGAIETLYGEIGVVFVPAKGAAYEVQTDSGCKLGAAWKKTSEDGTAYHSVKLDSRFLPKPLSCALFTKDDTDFVTVWNRPERKPQDGQ